MNLGDIIQPSIPGVIQTSNMSPPCHLFWAALVLECGSLPNSLPQTVSISFASACLLSQTPSALSLLPSQRYEVASWLGSGLE